MKGKESGRVCSLWPLHVCWVGFSVSSEKPEVSLSELFRLQNLWAQYEQCYVDLPEGIYFYTGHSASCKPFKHPPPPFLKQGMKTQWLLQPKNMFLAGGFYICSLFEKWILNASIMWHMEHLATNNISFCALLFHIL